MSKVEKASIILSALFIFAALVTIYSDDIGDDETPISVCLGQSPYAIEQTGTKPTSSLININLASSEELCSLSGIGEGIAEKIIEYREQNGAFRDIFDIIDVSGIGFATFGKIKGKITI